MNIIPSEEQEDEKKLRAITRRGFISGAIVAAIGSIIYITDDETGNRVKVYDLNEGYTHHKANFDELFVYADQNRTAPWSKKDGGQKDLDIPTGKGNEQYILSLKGDQMTLILSAYEHEYIWKYNVNASSLEVKGNIDFTGAVIHFGKLQNLIREQYPNF